MCAGPPNATRLLTQLPTSVGSCSDRRQSTSSQASGGGATRRPASDARCRRPGAQGSQAEPNDYLPMPATSMLSFMQKALRNLLVSDDEVIPARGCSRADGVAEPTSPPAPPVGSPSQRSEFNDSAKGPSVLRRGCSRRGGREGEVVLSNASFLRYKPKRDPQPRRRGCGGQA